MDLWDADAINLIGQGHITFDPHGGEMAFICVNISLDCRETGAKGKSLAFTFVGEDEGDEVSGSGTARLTRPAPRRGSPIAEQGPRRPLRDARDHFPALRVTNSRFFL